MITIREAQEADVPQLVRFVANILQETGAQKTQFFDEVFWRWEYCTRGREALIVLTLDDDRIVGAFHLTPRIMTFQGEQRMMVLLQDLGVDSAYRRHGVFVKMATFAIQESIRQGWDVTYSLPNQRSYPGFIKKLGYTHVASIPVQISPLNIGVALAKRLPLGGLWKAIATPFGWMKQRVFSIKGDGIMRRIERFTSDVDPLGLAFVGMTGAGCIRDSDFLNWRFINKPGSLYEAYGWYVNDTLRAYAVTRFTQMFGFDCILLMDFAGTQADLLPLLSGCMGLAYRRGIGLAVTMGLHPMFRSLRKLGFMSLPDRFNPRVLQFIVQYHTDAVTSAVLLPSKWTLTLADWDVL